MSCLGNWTLKFPCKTHTVSLGAPGFYRLTLFTPCLAHCAEPFGHDQLSFPAIDGHVKSPKVGQIALFFNIRSKFTAPLPFRGLSHLVVCQNLETFRGICASLLPQALLERWRWERWRWASLSLKAQGNNSGWAYVGLRLTKRGWFSLSEVREVP